MSNILTLTSAQLKHAADLKDKIDALNGELSAILGSSSTAAFTAPKTKRKMSASARAKIAAAQRRRWAKVNARKGKSVRKGKSKMSAAAKAKLSAAAKARWVKAKAAGKTKL